MGGLSSKKLKIRKSSKKEEKPASVTGIQYRDKEFKLSRETKSAYYFSDNAVSDDQGADKNGTTVVQKRVVLQKAGDSDHILFKRVRETPTAIYFEPNVETQDDNDKGEKKNIVLEKAPEVEEQIKVIRDGSKDIVIRPGSFTGDQNQSETNLTATETQGDDKGLAAGAEDKENKETHLTENEKEETVSKDAEEKELDEQKEPPAIQNEVEQEKDTAKSTDTEDKTTEDTDKPPVTTEINEKEIADVSEETSSDKTNTADAEEAKELKSDQEIKTVEDNEEPKPNDNTDESEETPAVKEDLTANSESVPGETKENDSEISMSPKAEIPVVENTELDPVSSAATHAQPSVQTGEQVDDTNTEQENSITDKETGVTIMKDPDQSPAVKNEDD